MTPIADIARGKWRSILPMLGVAPSFLTGKHGPCPACGGKDRFRFTDHEQSGGYVCNPAGNGCGNGDGVTLLCKVNGWSFAECARQIRSVVGDVDAAPPPAERVSAEGASRRLWDRAVRIGRDDDAARYLRSRGFEGPFGGDLRFVRECRVTGLNHTDVLPAMVALFRAPNGSGASVHRTYLTNGGKAPIVAPRRMMAGFMPPGCAIRLAPYTDVLGIAEGIETALRVMKYFGVPCWAASSANMLAAFQWPEGLPALNVYGDNDRKFGGQASAYALAHRAATALGGPSVEVHIPPTPGHDWDDHARAMEERSVAA